MTLYVGTETRQIMVEAKSAAEARQIAEAVFYARPGFDKEVRKKMRIISINVEKARD